jgi:hypothetical protein
MMITIRFNSGVKTRMKADNHKLTRDEILEIYVFTKDRNRLQLSRTWRAKEIDWARLDDGTSVLDELSWRYED